MTITRGQRFVEVGDDRLAVEVVGAGDAPVLLVHGSGANHLVWYRQIAALAAAGRTVVAPDNRGAGLSTDRAGTAGVAALALDLLAVCDALDLAQVDVVGHSLGAWAAARFAASAPARVRSVTLVGSTAGVSTPAIDEFWVKLAAAFSAPSAAWSGRVDLGRSMSLSPVFCDADPAGAYLYQLLSTVNPPAPPPPFDPIAASLSAGQVAALSSLDVAFVVGEHDPVNPPALVRQAADAVAGARFETFAGCGHTPFWEQPHEFAAWLVDRLGAT